MAEQFTLVVQQTSSLQRKRSSTGAAWSDNWKQARGEEHMLQGFAPNRLEEFRHLLSFTMPNWSNVAAITKAELHVFTAGDHSGLATETNKAASNLKLAVKSKTWTESGGGEKLWNGGLPDDGANYLESYGGKATKVYAKIPPTNLAHTVINVGNLVRYWAPTSVKTPWGTGQGRPNYGIVSTVSGTAPDYYHNESVMASPKHINTGIRPYLVITYEPKGGPGAVFLNLPDGTIPAGVPQFLTGDWERGRPGDTMVSVTIKISEAGKADWTWTHNADPNEVATSSFSVPLDVRVKSGITYAWTARAKTSKGDETPYAPSQTLRLASSPPSLTALAPTGSLPTLESVPFTARYTASAGQYRAVAWQVQMRTQLAATDPTWGEDLLWDTGLMTVAVGAEAATPVTTPFTVDLTTLYGGPALDPNTTYSYRMRALDPFGTNSVSQPGNTPWSYGEVSLLASYVPPTDDLRVNMTRYGKPPPHRIRIYATDLTAGKGRGPGKLLAELTDAANVGASEYFNSAGEFYFTLPATHPQVAVIEPYQVHYELQLHTGQGWQGKAFGVITDFDATEDEVVFYGQDYMAMLGRTVEERFSTADAELSTDKGGAKYVEKTVKQIVYDQLAKEKAKVNSPIGFINVNAADIADMPEKSTIYASFKQRLPFLAGLIDSSRAGTGRRTRLVPERNSDGVWRWRVIAAPGIDRPNIRLEYGGLVQGFRTIPFQNWGTAVDAVGRTVTGTKVYSARAVGVGINEATYGAWPTTTMYQDLDDSNDLQRRANQAAAKVSKVGKMLGLGIRVGALGIKDGWDITDSVKVDIKRGVVDTSRFGSGYWTIWGWTWNSYPDGHSNMVLSLSPKEDSVPPNPDLIESKPILDESDWQLSEVPPTVEDDGTFWLDTSTGDVYEKDVVTGVWAFAMNIMGPPGADGAPGPPGPPGTGGDPDPPPIPVIKDFDSSLVQQEDGSPATAIAVTVGYASPPAGLADLAEYFLQTTRFGTPADATVPDWTLATEWTVMSPDAQGIADATVVQPNALAATPYWLRVAAGDLFNNRSVWSSPAVKMDTVGDVTGPPQPTGLAVQSGMGVFSVRWSPVLAEDFAYVEVQWRVASPVGNWSVARVPGTTFVVVGVTNGTTYDIRARSVDRSGNTLDADTLSYKVDDIASVEKGWVSAGTATPVALPGSALVWDQATINAIFAGKLNADWIVTGNLKVGTGSADADAITVYDSVGNVVGRWTSANGIELFDPANPSYKMTLDESGLFIWDMTNPLVPLPVVSIKPIGIDAASITFGSARGGHNLIQNSSFELGAFGTSSIVPREWDVAADWNTSRQGADTNITTGATSLSMTVI